MKTFISAAVNHKTKKDRRGVLDECEIIREHGHFDFANEINVVESVK